MLLHRLDYPNRCGRSIGTTATHTIVFAILAVLVVVVVGGYFAWLSRYYKRMNSEENFREFHSRLSQAVGVADSRNAVDQPSLEDGTAFLTKAGLAVCVTFGTDDDGFERLHVSMSQPGDRTTQSVSSRFGFFATAMFGENKADLMPYFTESGIHHLVFFFRRHIRDLTIRQFDEAYSVYLAEYTPIPFEFQPVEDMTPQEQAHIKRL